MSAVQQPQSRLQGQRAWTDVQRAEQAAKLHARQIWLKSTGPKSSEGKSASSRNARHADYEQRQEERAEIRHIRAYLRTQKSYTDLLNLFIKQEHNLTIERHNALIDGLFFLENELIDLERQMFGGLRFSEICGLDNHTNRANIISFPHGAPP